MEDAPLQTTKVATLAGLEPYRAAWRALAQGAPMRSPEWLLVWWEQYAKPHDELCVLLFHEGGGELVGLAPLYLEMRGRRGTVRLLGSGEASSNHTGWLAAAGREKRVSRAVARFLLAARPLWTSVQLDSVDADDPAIDATVALMAGNGCLVRSKRLHNCWTIALPPTWEEYLSMLSRIQRKRCRKQQQLIDSGRVRVHRVNDPAGFRRGFDLLLQLHAARWGEANKPLGCFSDRRFREFHEKAALELLLQGHLLLVWLEFEGRPVAVEYQFIDGKTVYSYLAGMDPTVSEFSPGSLSVMASIRLALAAGCDSFDLSRGDQPYKAHWRAAPKAGCAVAIWPDSFSGRLSHLWFGLAQWADSGKRSAVRWIKAKLPEGALDLWRRLHESVTGRRWGPRKTGSPT